VNTFAISGPAEETVTLTVSGDWSIGQGLPSIGPLRQRLAEVSNVHRMLIGSTDLGEWESALLTFVLMVDALCGEKSIGVDTSMLSRGLRKLIELANATPARTQQKKPRPPLLARIGTSTLQEGGRIAQNVAGLPPRSAAA